MDNPIEDYMQDQERRRQEFLDLILSSRSPRKLIVAGPGTGKTFTFGQLFRSLPEGSKLALTFIRKLVFDMDQEFGTIAEASTFHRFCKRLLHERFGSIELTPYLPKIIREDAEAINRNYPSFEASFQSLREGSAEMVYYLGRGNYYRAVSFDDSVYKVYRAVLEGTLELPRYSQIVIDEYQDFNILEVEFINQLQDRGNILIVGDDDQAIYIQRNSSPEYLRDKYRSGRYKTFTLPYCSRCPRVVVEATSSFIRQASARNRLGSRITKPFIPYLPGKERINSKYPRIIRGVTPNIRCLSTFILQAIEHIPVEDISDSCHDGYPTALVIGQKQYLNPLYKFLKRYYPNISYSSSEQFDYYLENGYDILLANPESNLGWRIIAGVLLDKRTLKPLLRDSHNNGYFSSLLPIKFVRDHQKIIEIIRNRRFGKRNLKTIGRVLGEFTTSLISHYSPKAIETIAIDSRIPSILLSSFEGCKGLSAGHVFVVGLNEGVFPQVNDSGSVDECEFRKFIVAMTRTKKLLYLLSNWVDYDRKKGIYRQARILNWISNEYFINLGFMRINEITERIESIYR